MARKKKGRVVNGILLLNKQLGFSSNSSLQKAKRLFDAQKAGHTGSLDPLATGMLPVCFGEATKVSGLLLDADKRYQTVAQLGQTTDSGDAEGQILSTQAVPDYSIEDIQNVLIQFKGEISQIPPMYSALKKDGKPLYELARQGEVVERKARQVTIHELELLERMHDTLTLDVKCSKGTYIRTLVEDIGKMLGCGAYVKQLHRSEVSPFANYPMYDFDTLESTENKDELLLSIDVALMAYPEVRATEEQIVALRYGQRTQLETAVSGDVRVYAENAVFHGIGTVKEDGFLYPKKIMNL
jgi:tRNA pseudouridine55 synthase